MRLTNPIRSIMGVLAFICALGLSQPSGAQQGAPINPTASAVSEQQLFNALKPGDSQEIGGRITIPDQKAATLIRPAGREWVEFHQGTMHVIGAVAILGILALLAVFFFTRGPIKIEAGRSNQTITRFGTVERFIHWTTATCFIILAISGVNVTFGKVLLMPIIGEAAFASFTQLGKFAHNYLAFPFMIGLALMFLVWVKDNIPGMIDVRWFAQGGGLVGKGHPEAKRFNGGQKLVFWSVILGGAALSVSGWYLQFPYLAGGVLNLQFWNVVHGIVGVVLIGAMLAHAYIGSIGMEGAFDAMGSGEVDLNWAREHHGLWVADEMKKGLVRGTMQAAE